MPRICFISSVLLTTAIAVAAENDGLASRYARDKGIANDPAVLFADDFETGNLDKWHKSERRGKPTIVDKMTNNGQHSLEIRAERGTNEGGKLVVWFPPGADTLYCRFYVRFSSDFQYAHHFVTLLASDPKDRYRAFGKAGLKPDGTYFTTAMEPWFAWGKNPPPGEVSLYTYWPDMGIDRKMNKYWGNSFFPPGPGAGKAAGEQRAIPKLDTWQCWEVMVQCNSTPDKSDGRQAMWLDGKLLAEFTGFRWRTDPKVKIHCLWLELYGYDEGDPTKQHWKDSQTVWFDDVVAASKYIGPIRK